MNDLAGRTQAAKAKPAESVAMAASAPAATEMAKCVPVATTVKAWSLANGSDDTL